MSKLLNTLNSFTEYEFERFALYIHSPYFCQHAETIELFDFFRTCFPDFPKDMYSGFSKGYEGGKLTRARYNVLCAYLLKQVNGFLIQEKVNEEPGLKESFLIKSLLEREQFQEARKKLSEAKAQLHQQSVQDPQQLKAELKLLELEMDLQLSLEMRSGSLPLTEFFHRLDQYYLSLGLKYLLPAWTFQSLFNQEFPQRRLANFQHLMEEEGFTPAPLSQIYLHLLQLLKGEPVPDHLPSLLQLLEEYAGRMGKVEQMNVYGYLQNYFTYRQALGDTEALQHLFGVYQKLKELGLIFGRGQFSEHLIRNITITGCRLGKLEWTDQFLTGHKKVIIDTLGINTFAYSQAYLYFYQGKHSLALKHLQDLQFTDSFYRVGYTILLLRIYYELADFEALELLSKTFRRFLNRTDLLSEMQKDLRRNFLSILHQLAKAKEKGVNHAACLKIEKMLAEKSPITDPVWLNAKLTELRSQLMGG